MVDINWLDLLSYLIVAAIFVFAMIASIIQDKDK